MKEIIINPIIGTKYLMNLKKNITLDVLTHLICKKLKLKKNCYFLSINNNKIKDIAQIYSNNKFYIDVIPYNNIYNDVIPYNNIYNDNGNIIKTLTI